MLPSTLLVLFASSALGAQLRLVRSANRTFRGKENPAIIEYFSWKQVGAKTGANPAIWLPSPSEESPESFACTTNPGPDRLGCPKTIDNWSSFADKDGSITLAAGQCRAVTQNCCQTIICAPLKDLSIDPAQATGRMWNPLTVKCVLAGQGAMWQSEGGGLYIQMERPDSCSRTTRIDLRND